MSRVGPRPWRAHSRAGKQPGDGQQTEVTGARLVGAVGSRGWGAECMGWQGLLEFTSSLGKPSLPGGNLTHLPKPHGWYTVWLEFTPGHIWPHIPFSGLYN